MRRIQATAVVCLAFMIGETILAQGHPVEPVAGQPGSTEDWKLAWSDEFDTPGRPNPRNWTYEAGFVRNDELQWYQPENAWCEGGLLIIESRRERKRNPHYKPGST